MQQPSFLKLAEIVALKHLYECLNAHVVVDRYPFQFSADYTPADIFSQDVLAIIRLNHEMRDSPETMFDVFRVRCKEEFLIARDHQKTEWFGSIMDSSEWQDRPGTYSGLLLSLDDMKPVAG